jgi:hypothetical protein
MGPYTKQIEKYLFKHKWFIKYVPKKDRPKVLMEAIGTKFKLIYSTDFSSFEAHFVELLEDVEFQLYEHMLQNIPNKDYVIGRLRKAMLNWNTCIFKYATVKVWRRRMSGEMSTSLGNGITNLLLIKFIGFLLRQDWEPFVEGDDGVFGSQVEAPPKKWLYNNLGLDLKIEASDKVSEASFCGCVFDESDLLTVTNPMEALTSWAWTNRKYVRASDRTLMELLRAKSLSLLYEYPGHPVLQSAALYGIRITEGHRYRLEISNSYDREALKPFMDTIKNGLPVIEVPKNTRDLVEKLYGLTIPEQREIERYFDNKNDLEPVRLDVLVSHAKPQWRRYFETYSREYHTAQSLNSLMAVNLNCH